jgi:hypothetical protein
MSTRLAGRHKNLLGKLYTRGFKNYGNKLIMHQRLG